MKKFITVLESLRILIMDVLPNPTHVVVTDAQGNIGKADIQGFSGYGNIDGGSANSIELPSQNIDGGSATSIETGIIDGGNAYN